MCPGSSRASARMRRASGATASKPARQIAGSRFPCSAQRGSDARRGDAEWHAPIDADDVRALRHQVEQLPGVDPEMDARDTEIRETLEHAVGRVGRTWRS